jgi:hypothetical protein
VMAAGVVGLAVHRALSGFFGAAPPVPLTSHAREALEREKALALRSIKELEFDHAMGKIGDADFADIGARLRGRALAIMQELEDAGAAPPPAVEIEAKTAEPAPTPAPAADVLVCAACQSPNDPRARFCDQCGAKL